MRHPEDIDLALLWARDRLVAWHTHEKRHQHLQVLVEAAESHLEWVRAFSDDSRAQAIKELREFQERMRSRARGTRGTEEEE